MWEDADPRRKNRFLLIDASLDSHVQCHVLRTGRKTRIRKNRLRPVHSGYVFAADTDLLAEVQNQLGEAFELQLAQIRVHRPRTPKAKNTRDHEVNALRARQPRRAPQTPKKTPTVNAIESLLDSNDKCQQMNQYREEISTYMFRGVPGFTNKI